MTHNGAPDLVRTEAPWHPGVTATESDGRRTTGRTELEFEKDFSLIEPIAEIPHHQQNRAGLGNRREVPEPCKVQCEYPDSPIEPPLQDHVHRIDENGIRADHNQRKGPLPVALHFNQPIER